MTEDNEQLQAFLAAMQTGSHDDELDEIEDALKYRRGVIARRRASALNPGDTVRFTNGRPKYLNGLTAEVTKADETHVWVNVPVGLEYKRFSGAKGVRCPINIIEPTKG